MMNKRQKSVIYNFIIVVVFTAVAVIGMFNFKDYVNRSEAMRAMNHLGRICRQYREENSQVPSTHFFDNIKSELEGSARAGQIVYRGRWIPFGASDDEVLAYTLKNYRHSIFGKGSVVLRFDGRVEWMKKKQFEELLDSQQNYEEKELITQEP